VRQIAVCLTRQPHCCLPRPQCSRTQQEDTIPKPHHKSQACEIVCNTMGLQSKTSVRVTDIPRHTSAEEFRAFVKQVCTLAAKTTLHISRLFKPTKAKPTQGYHPPSDLETNDERQGLDDAAALGESPSRQACCEIRYFTTSSCLHQSKTCCLADASHGRNVRESEWNASRHNIIR
jgi:hypothetical protein